MQGLKQRTAFEFVATAVRGSRLATPNVRSMLSSEVRGERLTMTRDGVRKEGDHLRVLLREFTSEERSLSASATPRVPKRCGQAANARPFQRAPFPPHGEALAAHFT